MQTFRKKTPLILAALIMLSYILPFVLIDDGTSNYDGEAKEYAVKSLDDLDLWLSSPSFYKIYTTRFKVTSIERTDNSRCPYEASIQAYSFFGLRTQRFIVQPGCGFSGLG